MLQFLALTQHEQNPLECSKEARHPKYGQYLESQGFQIIWNIEVFKL
jgi:hypothetical protein